MRLTLRSALAERSEAAAARGVSGQHSDRDHEVHARPARARARPRCVLPRPAEDAGRRGREPRRRRVADRRRQAVLRFLDGAPVRRGVQRHESRARPTSRAWRWRSSSSTTRTAGNRRSSIAATIRDCRSSCASSTASNGLFSTLVAPLILGGKNLGWITLCVAEEPEGGSWWRIALVEAIARHAALALHKSRMLRAEAHSRNAARRSSRSAIAWRATFTTTSRRASAQS